MAAGASSSPCFGCAGGFFAGSDVEADLPAWRLGFGLRLVRWLEEAHKALEHVHNGGFVAILTSAEFRLQGLQLTRQLLRAASSSRGFRRARTMKTLI